MLISLVVPVYNVEKYLVRCVTSLLVQDLARSEYEIILVNDGSKDNSLAIGETLVRDNENIRLVSQQNKGLSGARNTGLKEATGTYVWFIDSDDSIAPSCLKGLTDFMATNDLDIAHIGFTHVFLNGNNTSYPPPVHPSGEAVSGESFFCDLHTVPTAWSFVHRRLFLMENGLNFFEGIIHEDEEFLPRAMFFAQKVKTYCQPLYYYYENSASIMGTKNFRSDQNKCIVLGQFQAFLKGHNCSERFENKVRFRAFILFQTILNPSVFFKHSTEEQTQLLGLLKNSGFYPVRYKGPFNAKFTLYRWLMNIDLVFYSRIRKTIG